eukprot:1160718-Pelagomonas_calceolata.AAC.8
MGGQIEGYEWLRSRWRPPLLSHEGRFAELKVGLRAPRQPDCGPKPWPWSRQASMLELAGIHGGVIHGGVGRHPCCGQLLN